MRVHKLPNETLYAFLDRALGLIEYKRQLTQRLIETNRTQWDRELFIEQLRGIPEELLGEARNAALLNRTLTRNDDIELGIDAQLDLVAYEL